MEKQLNFYVECRQCFANLDRVKEVLVQCVCQLCMRTLSLARGKHNKKTSAFIRVYRNYYFSFTTKGLHSILLHHNSFNGRHFHKTQSFVIGWRSSSGKPVYSTSRLTLPCCHYPHTRDSYFMWYNIRWLIFSYLPGTDKAVEEDLASFVGSLCGALVVAPGHPDNGPFYLVQGLLKVLKDYPWYF